MVGRKLESFKRNCFEKSHSFFACYFRDLLVSVIEFLGDGRVGSFQCRGVLLIWIIVGQGPTVLPVGTFFLFFSHVFSLFFLCLSGKRPGIDLHTVSKGR